MSYLFALFFLALLLSIFYTRSRKKRKQERQRQLEISWGKPKKEYFNFDLIARYAELKETESANYLSPQTLTDIDFREVFKFLDRTGSKPGQQFLYRHLLAPQNDIAMLRGLKQKADFFNLDPALRKEIRMLLSGLNDYDAYQISSLLEDRILQRPKWFDLVYIDIVLVAATVILAPAFPFLWIVLVFPFGFNLILHFWNKRNIFQYDRSLPQLNLLIETCNRISKKDIPFDKKPVQQHSTNLGRFQKKMKWIDFGGKGLKGDVAEGLQYFYEMIKSLFLIEFRALFAIVKELENKKADIEGLFCFVGQIELVLTVASLKESGYQLCTPQFTPAYKQLNVRNIYHPLIPDCVGNNLFVQSQSILITGSNMSGKTTFLRTLAINAIVAQALYLCFAESYAAPMLQVHSSIRIDDNLLTGESYYMAEVEIMAALIKAAASGRQNLFILDELFKGTNTIERVASAKAILSFLNQSENIVFVATHDIELVEMLKSEYDLYYFEESIAGGQIAFDHKLKSGQLHAGNAIRILEMRDYPSSIVEEAKTIAATLLATKENNMPLRKDKA